MGPRPAVHARRVLLRPRDPGPRAPFPRVSERTPLVSVRAAARGLRVCGLVLLLARRPVSLGSARGRRVPGLPAQPPPGRREPHGRGCDRRGRDGPGRRRPRHDLRARRPARPPCTGPDAACARARSRRRGRDDSPVLCSARVRGHRRDGGGRHRRGVRLDPLHAHPGRVPRRSPADADASVEGRGAGRRARLGVAARRGAGRDRAHPPRPLARARLLAPGLGTLRRPRRTRSSPSPRSPAAP